jgi:ribonuclease HI
MNSPKTTSLHKLANQHDHKCESISSTIPPWTDTAEKFRGRLSILDLTFPKDKRNEEAKKHTISVRAHASNQTILTIYTDRSKTNEGTGASYIAYHTGHPIAKKKLGMGNKAKAFDAEKWALTKSLTWAVKTTSNNPYKNIKTLKFYIDNAVVVKTAYDINLASGQWIEKHIKRDIDRWLEEKDERKIIIAWIPAHKGILGNEEANILVKATCSKTDTFKKSTRAYALCMNKEENLKEWKDRWLETVGKGRFAWANRCPPAWKPPPHLLNPMKCNIFGRSMQARIGHTHIGEYYRDFNIPEDTSCTCGKTNAFVNCKQV